MLAKNLNFKTEDDVPYLCVSYEKKRNEFIYLFIKSFRSLKKEVRSISQRYETGDLDSDPNLHLNITNPQHWFSLSEFVTFTFFCN
jgi:hypothetical protein